MNEKLNFIKVLGHEESWWNEIRETGKPREESEKFLFTIDTKPPAPRFEIGTAVVFVHTLANWAAETTETAYLLQHSTISINHLPGKIPSETVPGTETSIFAGGLSVLQCTKQTFFPWLLFCYQESEEHVTERDDMECAANERRNNGLKGRFVFSLK